MSTPTSDCPITDINQAQKALWFAQPKHPETIFDAIEQLAKLTKNAQAAYQHENLLQTQQHLEELFAASLIAMKCMDISPSAAIERTLKRYQTERRESPTLHIYTDQAVLKMGTDIRGRFPLYTDDDYEQVKEVALTFGCTLQHHDSEQLSLLSGARPKSPAASLSANPHSHPQTTSNGEPTFSHNVLPLKSR